MTICISVGSVVTSPLSLLFIWIFSLFFFVSLAKSLSVLHIFSKIYLLVSLIFSVIFLVWFNSTLIILISFHLLTLGLMSHFKCVITILKWSSFHWQSYSSPQFFHSSLSFKLCFIPFPWSLTSIIPLCNIHDLIFVWLRTSRETLHLSSHSSSICPCTVFSPSFQSQEMCCVCSSPREAFHCGQDPIPSDPLKNFASWILYPFLLSWVIRVFFVCPLNQSH